MFANNCLNKLINCVLLSDGPTNSSIIGASSFNAESYYIGFGVAGGLLVAIGITAIIIVKCSRATNPGLRPNRVDIRPEING